MNVSLHCRPSLLVAGLATAVTVTGACTSDDPDSAATDGSTGAETENGVGTGDGGGDQTTDAAAASTDGSSSDGADETAGVDEESSGTTGDSMPGFVPVPCRFLVSDELVAGADYECGDLAVPERRDADGEGTEINVHFVRFFGAADASLATVYLDGGPGGSGQAFAGFPAEAIEGFTVSSDFVVVAQRGTVLAEPSLTCDGPATDPVDAQSCRDALLASQVDLAGYTTPANADDIEDLRVALGYDQWNLLGISYGTRLAQEVMRRHPASVRAAVLDGVVPPQINWDMRAQIGFWQAAQGLAAACSADTTCQGTFGAFDQAVVDMIEARDANPLFVGPPGARFELDGGTAAQFVFRMMYETGLYPVLPLVVASFRDDDLEAIQTILMLFFESQVGAPPQAELARGMHWSVKCSDLYNPEIGPGIEAALMEAVVPEALAGHAVTAAQDVLAICDLWPKPEPDPSLGTAVASDIPTLISSGAFDPITPPAYGALVAESMTNDLEVTFANSGHGAMPESDCSRALFSAFIENPQGTIDGYDTSCATQIEMNFVTTEEEFLGATTPEQWQALATRLAAPR